MITEEQIKSEIAELETQLSGLKTIHAEMVAEHQKRNEAFNQQFSLNQAQYQQLTGAINQLNKLLATKEEAPQ